MPKVRVSMMPDKPIEVPESEIPVLRAQGLLMEDEPAATPLPPTPAGGKKDDQKEND